MIPLLLSNRCLKVFPILIFFLVLLPSHSLTGHPPPALASKHYVIRISDGDTILVNYKGKPVLVNLLHVNTPESLHPDAKENIPLKKIASDYTEKRLKGKYVKLEFEGAFRGRYGRLIAYVIVDGVNFNLELVRQGLSPYYTRYGQSQKYDKEFREAEKYARKHQLNIWGNPELTKKYLRLKSK